MKLFTLGPVEMEQDIVAIGSEKLPYFRTSDFSGIMKKINISLNKLLKTSPASKLAILTASGTAAMEAAVINMFNNNDRLIIINGGTFGNRFVEICDIYGIPYDEIQVPFGETFDISLLKELELSAYSGLLINIHETSTGQLYPIKEITEYCKKYNIYVVCDAISSFLVDPYEMDNFNIDVTILSSQKSLALPPGLSFVVMNEDAYNHVCSNKKKKMYYLNLVNYFSDMDRGQTPYTPAVGIILQLERKLENIERIGLEKYLAGIEELSSYFRAKLASETIEIPNYPLSNALTPLIFKENNARDVFNNLIKEQEIYLTPSGGELRQKLLRVGHLGALNTDDYDSLIDFLNKI
ncbi:aminotransferase class V-fold PLP-dependent enzyme [Evansella sp. AB-P1]|uniref:pyridoxal-phosphate-dependent aminotransferase family protein n=1 Tax=Evansella sp. AB-P1 TaxID=3037653 RepID=UPI00241EDB18|nr:aminotransferase class V-fold PLP-dependent enzyme [Evansella sp. AB-P1]MDG5786666.1 aminotransferase class V-fold PLP-dependent enzyme [Evansella sp. AB-P1]